MRFPTPTSLGGGTGGESEGTPPPPISLLSLADAITLPEGNLPSSGTTMVVATVDIPLRPPAVKPGRKKKISTPTVIAQMPELVDDLADIDVVGSPTELEAEDIDPLELVRVGQSILDRLLNNPVCQYFINMVPLTANNYHAVIKKPMDLTTMERRLWRTIKVSFTPSFSYTVPDALQTTGSDISTAGYANLRELESDFNRIYQNAVYFNPPAHIINKQAQAFRGLYKGLSLAFKDERLLPTNPLPQEVYRSDMVSLSKPGSLYLFRACTPREMDHKMTDLSNELYTALHQPLFEAGDELEKVTPESPRFARLYINKNRSILSRIRDQLDAKVLVLSDIRVTRPASKVATADRKPTDAHMVTLQARAIVVKPLGDKHDMITVGDLDCPIAWIMVAVVKSANITVDVPRRFERGVLSKMKHEIIPFNKTDKAGLDCYSVMVEALGLNSSPSAEVLSTLAPESVTPLVKAVSKTDHLSSSRNGAVQINQARKRSLSDTDFSPQNTAISSKQLRPTSPPPAVPITVFPSLAPGAQVQPQPTPNLSGYDSPASMSSISTTTSSTSNAPMEIDTVANPMSDSQSPTYPGVQLTPREQQMLQSLKVAAQQMNVPYVSWNSIKPSLTMDTAQGLFKRIYHFQDDDSVVAQNFKEMDSESFEQRVREVACLVKLRGLAGVGQIQSVLDDEDGHLVGLSMTKYTYTLKAFATNARKPLTACQKLSLVLDIVEAVALIHGAGLAHRDLSEVNIMVSEDPISRLADDSPRPWIRVIDFGKSVFVRPEDVKRWSIQEHVSDEELALLPLVVLPPDHGYKLYRSILTLPRSKGDHNALPPVDPRLEDVYSLGILIWRIFSGKSPWNGAIEDDLKTLRYLVSSDSQIKFQIEREVHGKISRELLLKCLTAESETRSTAEEIKDFLAQEGVAAELLKEFEALGSGRKKTRKVLD
ncbi:Receptor-interacting serine/threonine-protein kinase 1 [Podila epicladia]|nr:Receptor-interacting serine/threonine-protein kinase 1 [Podila epicladia]